MYRGLAERMLQNFFETFNVVVAEPIDRNLAPWAMVLSSFLLAVSVSFTRGVTAPIAALLLLGTFVWIGGVRPVRLVKAMVWVAGLTLAMVVPMALLSHFNPVSAISLILRALTASGFLVFAFTSTGYKGFMDALLSLGLRPAWVSSITLLVRLLPVIARMTAKALVAREARAAGRKALWLTLSTVVGDAIVMGYERAWRIRMAMEARGAFLHEEVRPKLGWKELGMTVCSLAASALLLAL